MRTLALAGLLACLPAGSPLSSDYSYVVLNHSSFYSLVRIGSDGKYIATIANGFVGQDLTREAGGDYIVANVRGLLRVSRSGAVTTIAAAPFGSQWMRVVQGGGGTFVVADNVQHALWRVSQDGNSVSKIVNYPTPTPRQREDTSLALDMQGNYMMLDGNSRIARLLRITPAGAVAEVHLNKSSVGAGSLLADGSGGYMAKEGRGDAIIRISAAGAVTELVKFNPPWVNIAGMVRDPATGEILALDNVSNRIVRIAADGRGSSTFSASSTYFRDPLAILVEAGHGE